MNGMERDIHDLLDGVVGEPPRRVTVAAVRRRVVRRRATQALSAGLAVVLVSSLGAAFAAGAIKIGTTQPAGPRQPAAPPRYYVASGATPNPVVRDTATGRVTGTIRDPLPNAHCGNTFAVAGRQTFFMICVTEGSGTRSKSVIYRFRVTGSGQATGYAPVPGGVFKGELADSIAASPDGSEVATEVLRPNPSGQLYTNSIPVGIFVISTRTGHRALWQSGPYSPHQVEFANAPDMSFTQNGNELVLLESRCHRGRYQSDCAGSSDQQQVRAYSAASRGGSLNAGRVLLKPSMLRPRGTGLVDAFITPSGSALTAFLNKCPRKGTCTQWLARIPLAGGPPSVLYRVRSGTQFEGVFERFFSIDPTGRYVIRDGGVGSTHWLNGWIGHGRLHPLSPANGNSVSYETW
ncbi:MAG: hypothetical protein ACRDPO_27995 [Streptosporangiaceae bacterium]